MGIPNQYVVWLALESADERRTSASQGGEDDLQIS